MLRMFAPQIWGGWGGGGGGASSQNFGVMYTKLYSENY